MNLPENETAENVAARSEADAQADADGSGVVARRGAGASAVDSPDVPAEDFKDRWLRAEAELQNYRRRAQRELETTRRDAEDRVLLDIIGAIDDLERALAAAREGGATESWTQGVELVANHMGEALARRGVTTVAALAEGFDPEFHEALLEVDPPPGAAPGSVVSVVLKGYRRGERVLRPARVVVARRDAASES